MGDPRAFAVRNLRLANGEELPILVDRTDGLPDFDATLYILTQPRARNLAASTLRSALRAIRFGYQVLQLIGVDFDQRLSTNRTFEIGELDRLVNYFDKTQESVTAEFGRTLTSVTPKVVRHLESVRMRLSREQDGARVQGYSAAIRLLYFRDFLRWKTESRLHSATMDDAGRNSLGQALNLMLDGINVRMPRGSTSDGREGLSAPEIKTLNAVTNVDATSNPWKAEAIKARNRLVVQLLLNLGIRKGELCGLKVNDIDFRANELTIHRRADDIDDPRPVQPNTKTEARVLALEVELARGLHRYIVNYRSKLRGARLHPFVFVANGTGKPLSLSAVDSIFRKIKASEGSRFHRLSPHLLRHTWNDRFSEIMEEASVDERKEEVLRSYAMGWKPGTGTAKTYTRRHVRKRANEASLSLQAKLSKLK